MPFYRSEGIVLSTLKFQERDQIVTLYSEQEGMVRLFIKGAYNRRKREMQMAPFMQGEFVYTKGRGELFQCREFSLIHAHWGLRKSLECLEAAADLAKILLFSQALMNPSPLLYQLFACYLRGIESFPSPHILTASFRLKILRLEGLFSLPLACAQCHTKLTTCCLVLTEGFCPAHCPPHAICLHPAEIDSLHQLAFCRSLEQLAKIPCDRSLERKILSFFDAHFL